MRHLLLVGLLIGAASGAAAAEVSVTEDGDRAILESTHLFVVVDSHGARIASLLDKQSGNEMIALWAGGGEIGGALDDRLFFTSMAYRRSTVLPGGQEGRLRFEARHDSGLTIVKAISLRADESVLRVQYELSNATQQPYRLWIRNFFVPGGPPLTEHHHYVLPLQDGLLSEPFAAEYFEALRAPWAAMQRKDTNAGLLAIVPGVEKFYFWQGSREHPTFEWLYPELPAGKRMVASLALTVMNAAAPDWDALAKPLLPSLQVPVLADVPGWVDEATRFAVTDAEGAQGFWLSVGRGAGKTRLPAPLEVDLPLDERRAVYVGINTLRDMSSVPVSARLNSSLATWVHPRWEVGKENAITVEPLEEPRTVDMLNGTQYRLWLEVNGQDVPHGEYAGVLELGVGQASAEIPLKINIWPVRVPETRPFDVRGYATIGDFVGGYEVTPEGLRKMDASLGAYAAIGGSVLDWTVAWNKILPNVRLADTGESLTEVARERPQDLALDNLPRLDFSYFDPWLEVAQKHGVTRAETYLSGLSDTRLQGQLLDPAVGKGRVLLGSPEAEQVIAWILGELRDYLEQRAFHGLFLKIADEISPEHIESYIRTAQVARRAGWRPFTTVTGMVARTAETINTMNLYCEQWQVSIVLKDDFRALVEDPYRLEKRETVLQTQWGRYTNGGAQHTWASEVFGKGLTDNHEDVEQFELFEDGVALKPLGGSPWGNEERDVFFRLGSWLYVSPRGNDPDKVAWRARYTIRVPDALGKPLASIDASDEVWFYGGSSRPYRTPYERTFVYPMMAAVETVDGYGLWAFQWWQASEKIVWYDSEHGAMRWGPAFLGYRDGWRDACLYYWTVREQNALSEEELVGEGEDLPIQLGEETSEVYRWRTIKNFDSPVRINEARRALLRAAAEKSGKGE